MFEYCFWSSKVKKLIKIIIIIYNTTICTIAFQTNCKIKEIKEIEEEIKEIIKEITEIIKLQNYEIASYWNKMLTPTKVQERGTFLIFT